MEQMPLFPRKEKDKAFNPDFRSRYKLQPEVKPKKYFRNKEEYYKSPEWREKRSFALNRANHMCQQERCGRTSGLEVHHITYDNLYDEKPDDLIVLCKKHHRMADRERAHDSWYESSFETYMEKKYGPHWDYFEGCYEEFDAWIERQEDHW